MISTSRILAVLFFLLSGKSSAAPPRPNIVFILADDLGWADTTLYGHTELYRTPNLERLAKRGMTFTRAYAASPLCSPTRASILTGQSPARTGITSPSCHLPPVHLNARPGASAPPGLKSIQPQSATRLRTDIPTLGKTLKSAGYRTGHFGKWHLGAEPYSPLEQGFDVDLPHWHGPGPKGSYVAPWSYPDFDPSHPGEHIEDRMASEAAAFIESNRNTPFFLNYWQFSVHAPFDAKEELIEKYRSRVDPKSPQRSPTYAAMVESLDDAVGTLLDTLDRFNLTDNTLILFFSDNGGNMYNLIDGTPPTSNVPLRGGKASQFEGGIRVPMVVSWPGEITTGSTSDALVQSTDFYPTLLDLLDLPKSSEQIFDGVSILPALKGRDFKRGPIFTYFPHNPPVPDWIPPSISIHVDQWKLIREFHQGEEGAHRYRLFDLSKDLGETTNLAKANPDLVEKLDRLIEAFLKKTKAVVPVVNPDFDPGKYRPELEGKNRVRQPKKKTAGAQKKNNDPFDHKLEGWKARQLDYTVKDGILTLKQNGKSPFLGLAAARFDETTRFSYRIKSPWGGKARVTWSNETPNPVSREFTLKSGDWSEQTLMITPKTNLGIFRLYLPAGNDTIEIDYLLLTSKKNQIVSDFAPPYRLPGKQSSNN